MNDNLDQTRHPALPPAHLEHMQAVRAMEWQAQQTCIETAGYVVRHLRGRKCSVGDVVKLLELASNLARRSASMRR